MACRLDVKKAILDEAFNEMFEGRYTFTRITDDTVRINNRADAPKSKALTNAQAKQIAEERLKAVALSFKNAVTGYVSQYSPYDPVTITLNVNPAYIEHEYQKLPEDQKTDPKDSKIIQQPSSITKTAEIKPGVQELFESNPELANAVYEALGIEINNFKLIPNNKKHPEDANTYDVIYNGGKIGTVALFEYKNKVIKGVKLDEKFRNKGLGKKLYKFLNLQANLQGGVLFSDPEQQSSDARRLWNSLINEGVVNKATADEQSLKFNIDYKQQAQQLYSNFLSNFVNNNFDTIIQDLQSKNILNKKCS